MDPTKKILIGCGLLGAVFFALIVAGVVWLATGPEGGVRTSNDMEDYATDYLEKHRILDPSEDLIAYYDHTMTMDGTEAVILTSKRLIYHKRGRNDSINLADIDDINHRNDGIIGDVFEVFATSGKIMKFEIALWNGGETFKNILMRTWQRAKEEPTTETVTDY